MANSLLATDGYKFSMAEAGWPLRPETFYYTHRKGGPQVVPLDIPAFIKSRLPVVTPEDYAFLDQHQYEMGIGYKAAMQMADKLIIDSLPEASIFYDREPVFSATGVSALTSWLEPTTLGELSFRIQVATMAILDRDALSKELETVTCKAQAEIVRETCDRMGIMAPPMKIDPEQYYARVLKTVKRLVEIVKDPGRIFEVGLRSATCMEQHEIALQACLDAGVKRTSNAYLAKKLGMIPVGTMGHEHVQRFGSDFEAFRAMRDRRPYRSSYLLDTYDTFLSGIPAAFRLIQEDQHRGDSIRFDSGDKMSQYFYAISKAKTIGLRPLCILEDGFNDTMTISFEEARENVAWKMDEQFYGYGGHIVAATAFGILQRDRVQAVWKLCQTGDTPTMKFGNEPGRGKESVPGKPVVFRLRSGNHNLPIGIVGQQGEDCPDGYAPLTNTERVNDPGFSLRLALREKHKVHYSPDTLALKNKLSQRLHEMKASSGERYASIIL